MMNLFKKRKCGNCKHWTPRIENCDPLALFYPLGSCVAATITTGFMTGDFVMISRRSAETFQPCRNFCCNRHKFK
jgi:hypothetical protein